MKQLDKVLSEGAVYELGLNLPQGKIIIDILEYEREK